MARNHELLREANRRASGAVMMEIQARAGRWQRFLCRVFGHKPKRLPVWKPFCNRCGEPLPNLQVLS